MPKRILIIARDFPPYANSLGSVLRMLKLGDFLVDSGYEVHVLAAEGEPVSTFGYDATLSRFKLHYVPDRFQRYATRFWIRQQTITRDSDTVAKESAARWVKTRLLAYTYKSIIPDGGLLYAHNLADAAQTIAERFNIRNVIVSSPPHSTQAVGYILKQRMGPRINYILDYRDSWNTLGIFAAKNPVTRWISQRMEASALNAADHITYQSAPVLTKLNSMFFNVSSKATLVMNGFDEKMSIKRSALKTGSDTITIGYFGAINDIPSSYRNPTTFFEAVESTKLPMKVIFFGDINLRGNWDKRLGEKLEIYGSVSHDEALHRMSEMDILMLLHSQEQGSDEVIPGKLFEYIFAERPILALGPDGMESRRIVKDEGIGYTADASNKNEIERTLLTIYSDWKEKRLPEVDAKKLSTYSRQNQYRKILPYLLDVQELGCDASIPSSTH
ncbi:MAG: glycosyl transferase family 1 [Nitrospirales bacterium]|nr:MAG: glycosyl transferase family 1 [Nitrospirales bacterium]